MPADHELRPGMQATEDNQAVINHPGNYEPVDSCPRDDRDNEDVAPRSANSLETNTAEEDDDEWDPAMLEQMLEQTIEGDGDETESEADDLPGWSLVLSPPLSTSKHSTPPEVMRWVRWQDINESFEYIFRNIGHFMRQSACLNRALRHVDYNVDLNDFHFPYGAEGEMRVPRPLPRKYRVRRQNTGPASRRQVETLVYTASDIHDITLNVKLQLWKLQTEAEAQNNSEPEGPVSDEAGPATSKRAAETVSTSEESTSGGKESSRQPKKARYS